MNLYTKDLTDHYKNPRNYGKLKNPNISSGEYNPSCGDSIEIEGIIDIDVLLELNFTGKGCIISQAMASILTLTCSGKNIKNLLLIKDEDILNSLGFALGPNRAKCALLSLHALRKGLISYQRKPID